jgi:hypothetical protein
MKRLGVGSISQFSSFQSMPLTCGIAVVRTTISSPLCKPPSRHHPKSEAWA